MRSILPGLMWVILIGGGASASGQTGDGAIPKTAPPTEAVPPARDGAPAEPPAPPSPDVIAAPPVDDFLVIPLRAHILAAPELPAADCHLRDDDIQRVVTKANGIWHKAGIHWALAPVIHEAAAKQDQYREARAAGGGDGLGRLKLLAPAESKGDEGMDVYYIHAFEANGVFLGGRTAFVQETAKLRPVPGGIDEPLPRVTAHELGHALGLPHRQDRTNLLASGTTGTLFNQAEVDRARRRAAIFPGTATVPDLRKRLDAAQAAGTTAEVDRLAAILAAITPAAPDAAKPPQ